MLMKIQEFPCITIHDASELESICRYKQLQFHYSTATFKYSFLFQDAPGDYLFVLFHGAKDRKKSPPPYYDRWSWANQFPGAVLNVSDPTLNLSEELFIAWYIGNHGEWPLEVISGIILRVMNVLNKKRVVTYGSSMGGFAAIATQTFIKDSIAIAINPQTDVTKYHSGRVKLMFKCCFDAAEDDRTSFSKLKTRYPERLDLVGNAHAFAASKIVVVQNTFDLFHYRRHYAPFAKALGIPLLGGHSQTGAFSALLYASSIGHGPENRQMVPDILKYAGITYSGPTAR